jgi:antitoxin component YwqK of YwqJK toxin-antitoxin module
LLLPIKMNHVLKQYQSELVPLDARSDLGIDPDDPRDYYFKNGKAEIKHGQNEIYYDNGNIFGKGYVDKGYRVGAWQYYYEAGTIWQRGFYVYNGHRLSNGDTWQYYDKEGSLMLGLGEN